MPTSRHALTFAALVFTASLLPACASTPVRAAGPYAHPGLTFAMPACDSAPRTAPRFARPASLNERCERGEAGACFDASLQYACGIGVTADERRAAERALRACEAGHTPACAGAGALYMRSPDEADLALGLGALRLGCAANDGDACNNLAVAMAEGLGVREDERGALFMFDKLCKQDNRESCGNAGTVRENLRREAALVAPPCEGDHPCISVVVAAVAQTDHR
jgi:TPR repeat protein